MTVPTPAAAPDRIELPNGWWFRLLDADLYGPDVWDLYGPGLEVGVGRLIDGAAARTFAAAFAAQPAVSASVVPDELRALANAPGLSSVDPFRSAAARWVRSLLAAQPAPDAPHKQEDRDVS